MQNKQDFVTQNEVPILANATLVSKTDTKGIIKFANDTFVAISGYTREELINKNHNMVCHPDMPPQAFKWMWETLKVGCPWRATVKNRNKNGDHYWVRTTVVPLMENNKIVGYISVGRVPTRDLVTGAEALYLYLNQSGQEVVSKYERWKFKNWSIKTKMQVLIQGALLILLILAQLLIQNHLDEETKTPLIFGQLGLHVVMFCTINYFINKLILRPICNVERAITNILQGDLNTELDISIQDEMGGLLRKSQIMQSYLCNMVEEIVELQRSFIEGTNHISGMADKIENLISNYIKEAA